MITKVEGATKYYDEQPGNKAVFVRQRADGSICIIDDFQVETEIPQDVLETIEAKTSELQAEYDAQQYSRDRVEAYPAVEDQLDMLFHAIEAGTLDTTSEFFTTLKAVKDANPKA